MRISTSYPLTFLFTLFLCAVTVKSQNIVFKVDELDCIPGNTGTFILQLRPDWAPIGVDRIKQLTTSQFWNGAHIFRVIPGFVAQFGISGDPNTSSYYKNQKLTDDPVLQTNSYGTVTFATSGPNARTTQIFINYADNSYLDASGFAPIGQIIQGMDVAERICDSYGGNISQGQLMSQGNSFLDKYYPGLSYIYGTSMSG